MSSQIHFEQLVEEVRASYPQAQTIWATEQPLAFSSDGVAVPLESLMAAHQPLWITVTPSEIPADGVTAAILRIVHPARANLAVTIRLTQANIERLEEITLDSSGMAEMEIAADSPGDILIETPHAPVREIIQVMAI